MWARFWNGLGRLVGLLAILSLMLGFIGLCARFDPTVRDGLRVAWLCRFPLTGALFLLGLSLVRLGPLRPVLGGLVSLGHRQLMLVSSAAAISMLTVFSLFRTLLELSPVRYPDTASALRASVLPALKALAWPPDGLWWQLMLIAPLLVVCSHTVSAETWHSGAELGERKESGQRVLSFWLRLLLSALAAALTLVLVRAMTTAIHGWIEPRLSSVQGSEFLRNVFGPGYFSAEQGRQGLLPFHLENTAALGVLILLYGAAGWLFRPGTRSSPIWTSIRDNWGSALFSLLLLVNLLLFLLSGIAFFLDYWRISTAVWVGLLSYLIYRFLLYDHYFTTTAADDYELQQVRKNPGESPSAAAKGIAKGLEFQSPVPEQVFFVPSGKDLTEILGPPATTPAVSVRSFLSERTSRSGQCAVIFTAYGGGILAGAWSVRVMSGLMQAIPGLRQQTRLISGVSGGAVGTMFLVDELLDGGTAHDQALETPQLERVNQRVRTSSLEATAWGLTWPGLLRLVAPVFVSDFRQDNGWALEQAWQSQLHAPGRTLRAVAGSAQAKNCPHVILNAVCTENGRRFQLSTDPVIRARDRDGLSGFDFFGEYSDRDIRMATAARLSASFPFVSPIARIDVHRNERAFHFADGGYFDNFGVFSACDWIRRHLDYPQTGVLDDVDRIVLIRICARPPGEPSPEEPLAVGKSSVGQFLKQQLAKMSLRVGWWNSIFGPLMTLVRVRAASQAERVSSELDLLQRWCKCVHDVRLHHFAIELDFKGPLSWKLEQSDRDGLDAAWAQWLSAIREQVDPEDEDSQRRYGEIQTLRQFLENSFPPEGPPLVNEQE